MNEEEKQAIECLKHSIFEYEEIDTSVLEDIDKNHKIIYKLILKQHKEIEKLKSKKYILNAETNEIKEIPISENYISKDKIREKIKELEKEYKKYDKEELINLMKITSGKISSLEELLGD